MAEPGLPKEAMDDPFRPPEEPCMVRCLHCDQEYSSAQIVWRDGFWSCPIEGCGGAGYQFDIHPLDSSLWNDDEDEADGDEDEMDDDEPPQNNCVLTTCLTVMLSGDRVGGRASWLA